MADFGNITSPVKAPNQGSGRSALVVQIADIPKALSNNAKAVRLEGRIGQINQNGTVQIETEYGNINVKVRGRQTLQQGQKLEVEIPAGRPPRQAALRPTINTDSPNQPVQRGNTAAASNNTQLATKVASQSPQTAPRPFQDGSQTVNSPLARVTTSGQTPPAQTATPQAVTETSLQPTTPQNTRQSLPIETLAALNRNVATNTVTQQTSSQPLIPDSVVRLLPVQPIQAQSIAVDFSQTISLQPSALNRVPFTANLIAQNAVQNLPQNLLQIPTPTSSVQTTTLQTAFTPQIQNTLQPILNNSALSQTPILQNVALNAAPTVQPQIPTAQITAIPPTQITAIPPTQIIPQGQIIPLQSVEAFLSQSVQNQTAVIPQPTPTTAITGQLTPTPNNTVTLLPVSFDPSNTASFLTPRTTPIDAQIIQINPPNALLTPPQNTAQPLPAATVFTPPMLSNNPATAITAQVTGFTPQGLPLVTTQWPGSPLPQSFILQHNSSNLSLGSQLQISVKAPPTTQLPVQTLSNPLLRGFQWPAIDDLYNGLLQISPQAAASLGRSLPSPVSALQIAPAAMMFIAAVKAGDIGQFLGQNKMDLLQRSGRENILSRLTQGDAATARAPTGEVSTSGDWRAVPLPMFWEGEIHKITLYTRNENAHQQPKDNENGQTRFVFDLSLSRMGDVQLDGLLRDERLDLVVRTQHAFSEPMQQTMRQAYTTALDHTDLRGELNFQGSTKNWVHVLEKNEQLGVDV